MRRQNSAEPIHRSRAPWHTLLVSASRDPMARLRVAVLVGLLLLLIGVIGYMVIEHYSLLDALFMTVITLATVGYDEVHPLHPAGKVFTIFLIVMGIGTATWVLTTFVEVFVSEQALTRSERSRMDSEIALLKNHYILCGFGRIGREIVQGYTKNKVPYVVIEQNPERAARLLQEGTFCVEGDGADDDVLRAAGIERARCLIAVTPSDAVNTFIVLSARGLRSDLFIVARCDAPHNEPKLLRAGANRVVSTHVLGGRWMATLGVNPAVIDFVLAMVDQDHAKMQLRDVVIREGTQFDGITYGAANLKARTGALIVAIRRAGAVTEFVPNPRDDMELSPGDVLIAMGSPTQLRRLAVLIDPENPLKPLTGDAAF